MNCIYASGRITIVKITTITKNSLGMIIWLTYIPSHSLLREAKAEIQTRQEPDQEAGADGKAMEEFCI